MNTEIRHKFTPTKHEKMGRPIYPDGKFIIREDSDEIMNDYFKFSGSIASNEEINLWVDKCLTYFENNPDSQYWRTRMSCGGTTVIALKWQDDDGSHPHYEIIVAHNYYEAFVNKDSFVRPTEDELIN